ncbi:protein kinase [Streptomyces sp. NPDC056002]|uniref:WD40 repeat domain-containing serine/threonine protein kinase n=1 Tax=Streptomyces sp. NPDC056002 TaxID=3345675 RepID=UPI0035DDDC9B
MTQTDDELIGGRYRLVRQVGRGGMGIVWQAQDELLDRFVAIKQLILPSGTSTEVRVQQAQRVEREARMAARLDHPGIVRVYDVIDWDSTPAIVMEYVQGRSLGARLREATALTVAETVRLGSALLDALRHAHDAGVVHRDLKPDNILLAGTRTVITDFGIARPLVGATTLTPHGALIGTPAFMAPEQIEGKEVTAASDLWSLGVTLYTAVEGVRPFDAETITELCLAILTRPMPKPHRAGPLASLLEALLTKDPAARATVQAAAQHLSVSDRIVVTQAPEPATVNEVLAETQPPDGAPGTEHGEPSAGQQTLPTAATGHPDTKISVGPEPAVPEEAGTNRRLGTPVPGPQEPTRTARLAKIPQKPSPDHRARTKTGPADQKRPALRPRRRLVVLGTLVCALSAAAVIIPLLLPDDSSTPRAHAGSHSATPSTPPAHAAIPSATPLVIGNTGDGGTGTVQVTSVAFAPNGKTLAIGLEDGNIDVWNTDAIKITTTLTDPSEEGVESVAFAPKGSTLAVADRDGNTYLWDTTTRKRTATLPAPHSQCVNALAFAPDDITLAADVHNGTIYLWDTTTRKHTANATAPSGHCVNPVAFAPKGSTLAAGDGNGSTYLWDTTTGKHTATLTAPSRYYVSSLAFAPNAPTLAIGNNNQDYDGTTDLWNTTTGKHITTLTNPYNEGVSSVAFSPNGSTLAVGDGNGSTYLWDTTTRKLITTLTPADHKPGPTGVTSVAFSPNGSTLAVGNSNGNTYLWKIAEAGTDTQR